LTFLSTVSAALPPGSNVESRQANEPKKDRCATSSTAGYDPATVLVVFTTSWDTARLETWVGSYLTTHSWRSTGSASAPEWTATSAGQTAHAKLLAGQTSAGAGVEWTLMASTPSRVKPLPDC